MGKFNNTDGVNFLRRKDDVINDYANFLLEQGFFTRPEHHIYITERREDVYELLRSKLYETEEYKGMVVNTLDSFYHFCRFVIKEYAGVSVWNNFMKEMYMDYEYNKDTCKMASRSLGKSFFNYVLYPSFKMWLYNGTKFIELSETPKQCTENLRILKDVIDTNEVLYSKKETWKGKELKWTERQIEYNGGMLITVTIGTSPKGLHVHYGIADDIRTEAGTMTDDEIENYILGQFYPCMQRLKGRCCITGTPVSPNDIYHRLMQDKPNFEGNLITDGRLSSMKFFSRTTPIADENMNPTLPDIFSKDEILRIREKQGEQRFMREYMLVCTDETTALFSEHLINGCQDISLRYLYSPEVDQNGNYTDEEYLIAADVATSGEASADFSAFIVLGIQRIDKGIKKIVRHVVHEKGMPIVEQVNTLKRLSITFKNAPVVVEKNNVGVALIQELINQNVNVREFVTTKDRKNGMIRYLEVEMKNKNLWFPENVHEVTKLKKELLNFGVKRNKAGKERMEALSGKDDLVMALIIANTACQEIGGYSFAIVQD